MDSNPDEISLALDALNAKSIQDLAVLDTCCVLPGTWNLMEPYSDIADLMYDANDLGLVLDSVYTRWKTCDKIERNKERRGTKKWKHPIIGMT